MKEKKRNIQVEKHSEEPTESLNEFFVQTVNDFLRKAKGNIRKLPLEDKWCLLRALSYVYESELVADFHWSYPKFKPVQAFLHYTMKKQRCTRAQLARKLGISYYQLCVLMRGEVKMSLDTAYRLMSFEGSDGNFLLRNA